MSQYHEHEKLKKLPKGCLGYADELSEAEKSGKEVCGVSGLVFHTRQDYLNHTSPVTGFKPTQVEHQDALTNGRFSKVSAKAVKRGEDRKQ